MIMIIVVLYQRIVSQLSTDLDNEGDEHGEHGEREAEDVEERESHKGLVCRQSVVGVSGVFVHQCKCSKRGQSNLCLRSRNSCLKVEQLQFYSRKVNSCHVIFSYMCGSPFYCCRIAIVQVLNN